MDDQPDPAFVHPPHAVVAKLRPAGGVRPPAPRAEPQREPRALLDESALGAAMPHGGVPMRAPVMVPLERRRIDLVESGQIRGRRGQRPPVAALRGPFRRRRSRERGRRRLQRPPADELGQQQWPERRAAAALLRPGARGFRATEARRAARAATRGTASPFVSRPGRARGGGGFFPAECGARAPRRATSDRRAREDANAGTLSSALSRRPKGAGGGERRVCAECLGVNGDDGPSRGRGLDRHPRR